MNVRLAFKRSLILLADSVLFFLSGTLAAAFLIPYVYLQWQDVLLIVLILSLSYAVCSLLMGICTSLYRYTGLKEILKILLAVTFSTVTAFGVSSIWIEVHSFRFAVLLYLFSLLALFSEHVAVRMLFDYRRPKEDKPLENERTHTLLVGAGEAGRLFVQQVQKNNPSISIIGIVDDDPSLHFRTLFGVPIIGSVQQIPDIAQSRQIDQITIAIPTLKPQELKRIVSICNSTSVPVNRIPLIEDILAGKLSVQRFREVDVVDLLGREEVELDTHVVRQEIEGKTIFISGAGGSIGSEITRIVSAFAPKKVVLLGHGENSIYHILHEMNKAYGHQTMFIPVIASIQNEKRMEDVMAHFRPDIVYHAAAHKHVPMMERNPYEAIQNNVFGTYKLANAAKQADVPTFVMISTDKAVNPPNVMGATKRIAEMIVTTLNEPGKTRFCAVRFGNVLGSRGSVVPLFKQQIKAGGPVTVTDFRMTRYFMTIPEASRLVIQAGTLTKGGELFVLDMGKPVKVIDLAKNMIRLSGYSPEEIPIIETGIRPGEKLYEELLVPAENTGQKIYDKIFVGRQVTGSIQKTLELLKSWEHLSEDEVRVNVIRYAREVLTETATTQKRAHLDVPGVHQYPVPKPAGSMRVK